MTGILQRRFSSVDPKLISLYGSALFPLLLLQDDNSKEPDYSKPGEAGTRADPHEIHVSRKGPRDKGDWEEIIAKEFTACDNIVIKVDLRLIDTPRPPENGFASLVKRAVREARELAETPPVPG